MKQDDGYITYVLNPKSGASSSKLTERKFREYLRRRRFEIRISETSSLNDARELATEAAVDYNCAMVVAAGGDGTVREVAHGLEGSDKPLLVVPVGTENLLANELGIDKSVETIIAAFEDGNIAPLDLGCANGECFTSVVGFGFDGEVVCRVSQKRKGHINQWDYFWPIWRTFWSYQYPVMRVEVDGKEVFDGEGLVFVGNISKYAIGLGILRNAEFSDGLLDICIYRCRCKIHLLKHAFMTVVKQNTNSRDLTYLQGKEITVSGKVNRICTEMDGDPGPQLPVEIKIMPRAVNVLIPKGAKPAGIRRRLLNAIG